MISVSSTGIILVFWTGGPVSGGRVASSGLVSGGRVASGGSLFVTL